MQSIKEYAVDYFQNKANDKVQTLADIEQVLNLSAEVLFSLNIECYCYLTSTWTSSKSFLFKEKC